jgi:hypothetical protein
MTIEEFAEHLNVAVRTVVYWRTRLCCRPRTLFVYVYVLINDLMAAGVIAIRAARAPLLPAATPSCSSSRRSTICWAAAARRCS